MNETDPQKIRRRKAPIERNKLFRGGSRRSPFNIATAQIYRKCNTHGQPGEVANQALICSIYSQISTAPVAKNASEVFFATIAMFDPVTSSVSLPKQEEKIIRFWRERAVYEKTLAARAGGKQTDSVHAW